MRKLAWVCVLGAICLMGSSAQITASYGIVPSGGNPHGAKLPPKEPIRVSGGVMAGNRLTMVQPKYPAEARARHIGGTVVLRVIVGKDGLVKDAEAIFGPDLLRQPYIDAVKQWTYKPYLLNGHPVEVETVITINIQLNGGS